jgi:CheY-like chemotaxis protein
LLLVEDDVALLRVQKRGLELLGHRVAAFDEPVAAFAALRSEPLGWAAVVTDFDLPGLRGSEFARAVRELFPTLPIVLTSGLVTAELTLAVQQLGGARVLAKPFLPRDLASLLAELLAEQLPRD